MKLSERFVLIVCGLFLLSLRQSYVGMPQCTKRGFAKAEMDAAQPLFQTFRQDCGRFPTTAEGLKALQEPPKSLKSKWRGPYGSHLVDRDAWDHPYGYTSTAPDRFELIAYGSDGVPGGDEDDVDLVVHE